MSTTESKFQRAYDLAVVEGEYREAIAICREVLANEPSHHMARMLLANLLDDHGDESEIKESKKLYLEAIKLHPKPDQGWWHEENPLRNLAIWEEKNGSDRNAELLYLLDSSFTKNGESIQQFLRLLQERDADLAEVLESVLSSNLAQ